MSTTSAAPPATTELGSLLVLPLVGRECAALRTVLAHADAGRTAAERAGHDPRVISGSAVMAERLHDALRVAAPLAADPAAHIGEPDVLVLPHAGVVLAGPGCAAARVAHTVAARRGASPRAAWQYATVDVSVLLARAVLHGDDPATVEALAQLVLLCDEERVHA